MTPQWQWEHPERAHLLVSKHNSPVREKNGPFKNYFSWNHGDEKSEDDLGDLVVPEGNSKKTKQSKAEDLWKGHRNQIKVTPNGHSWKEFEQ